MARRVMDLGGDNHILATDNTGEELRELSEDYRNIVHPVDFYTFKHGKRMMVYSLYGDGFGNPEAPKKGNEINELRILTDIVTVKLNEKSHVTTRRYEIRNYTDSAIVTGMGYSFRKKSAQNLVYLNFSRNRMTVTR
jgi:hypothetical protein